MLVKDRKQRLGQANDVDDILNHPWFADIDTDKLLLKQVEPPYLPKIDDAKDLSNFDPEVTAQSLKESILPEESISKIMDNSDAFKDFGPLVKQDLKVPKTKTGTD
jgi:hypothetical protein